LNYHSCIKLVYMDTMIQSQYSDEIRRAIGIAQSLAKEYSHEQFSPAHLLKALLHKDIGLAPFLESLGKDIYYLEEWAEVRIESSPKAGKIKEEPPADDKVREVLNEADSIRLKLSRDLIDPVCVFASLSTPGVGFTYDQLKTFTVTQQEVLEAVMQKTTLDNALGKTAKEPGKGDEGKKTTALLKFCIDKTSEAQQGKLDPVTGRDREIRMIAEVLGRRSKPNVLLIGDPGVGKTSVVNGFAQHIIAQKVPQNLLGAKIFELDFGALIAGASYKGEVEDRLKSIIKEIELFERAILFIDEIHMLLDKQGGAAGAANLLKPELSRGVLTIIGITSVDNYTKFIESDEAFNRQFEIVKVEEPTEEIAVRMMEIIAPVYEKHHDIKMEEGVLAEAVRLARRYLRERSLPDSAIDLMDRTMAGVRMMKDTSEKELADLKIAFEAIEMRKNELAAPELLKELRWYFTQAKNKLSPVLLAQLETEQDPMKIESADELHLFLTTMNGQLETLAKQGKEMLLRADVAAVVSHKTGIPIGKVQTQERDRLLNMEDQLKKRVVGQDHCIHSIAEAILESRSGLSKAGQPIGSFFFLGPTGTGKTELAKSLAEFLFQDESFMIRFDMSEFKEEHSAALLYGAPPGYVGYEEGGLLVNKIRQQPYSVVLFDEIEKAHTSVFDIFLQILDEGKLHDRLGKEGDFSNAVILFTSNIGSDHIVESFGRSEIPKSQDLMEIMGRYFRPEFLGRLTEIVPFAPISEQNIVKIFDIHLKNLLKSLDLQGIKLEIDDEAKKKLAMAGFTPKYGARPIIGTIRSRLRRPLSRMIISGEIGKGSVVTIKTDKEGEIIWKSE
jgi:ATP-dependent Clp protease ATP-binding subunit ClpB